MVIQSDATAAVQALATLYEEMRNQEFILAPNRDVQVEALITQINSPTKWAEKGAQEELIYPELVRYMAAYTRVDRCREAYSQPSERRKDTLALLSTIGKLTTELENAFVKLQNDAMRNTFTGHTIDTQRLGSLRDLYRAMSRGWVHDVDPTDQLEPDLKVLAAGCHPEYNLNSLIPELTSPLSFLTELRIETKRQAEDFKEIYRATSISSLNLNLDKFILDVARCFQGLTGRVAKSWADAGTSKGSKFYQFLSATWECFPVVAIDGRWVHRNALPSARTVTRILTGTLPDAT